MAATLLAGEAYAQDLDFLRKAAGFYSIPPDIEACDSGKLAPEAEKRALDTVNDIRGLHGLPAVRYDPGAQSQVMAAALVIAANGRVSHRPLPGSKCFSVAAYDGAQSSNLHGAVGQFLRFETIEQQITDWLTDERNMVSDNIGHRRWLLDPFLEETAYGRVAGSAQGKTVEGAALKIISSEAHPTGFTGSFVAYPFHDYPARYYADGVLLSFAAVISPESRLANKEVDYSTANITIRKRGGDPLAVSRIAYDNVFFGIPNNIQFSAGTLERGAIYEVTIAQVRVKGASRDYSYWFRIVPEAAPPPASGTSKTSDRPGPSMTQRPAALKPRRGERKKDHAR